MNNINNKIGTAFVVPALCVLSVACDSDTHQYRDTSQPVVIDFNADHHDFSALFSDYPQGQEGFFELASSYQQLPTPYEDKHGYRLYGSNRSDDLFMGLYGKIDNLKPAKRYNLSFKATIVTNIQSNCAGIGGPPGESVYIKVATHSEQPKNSLKDGMYRLNWDVGTQGERGEHSQVVGDISNGIDCMAENRYIAKEMSSEASIPVMANDNGDVWIMVGSDSGFEGPSELFISHISVAFTD